MDTWLVIALYSALIVIGALGGAVVPLLVERATPIVLLLAFAAGVMLGAVFFQLLPEAFVEGGYAAFAIVPLGFFALLLLERYVLVHFCDEPPGCAEHGSAGTAGLATFLGLSAHTLFDGVALGSAVVEGVGLTAVVAIAAHKIPSSLSLAAILRAEGARPATILARAAVYGLMVPAGVALYFAIEALAGVAHLASWALAFSAGTFLYIAVSDLIPHVNRHSRGSKLENVFALALGLATMFIMSMVLRHAHGQGA